jgi:hypothetical protein
VFPTIFFPTFDCGPGHPVGTIVLEQTPDNTGDQQLLDGERDRVTRNGGSKLSDRVRMTRVSTVGVWRRSVIKHVRAVTPLISRPSNNLRTSGVRRPEIKSLTILAVPGSEKCRNDSK